MSTLTISPDQNTIVHKSITYRFENGESCNTCDLVTKGICTETPCSEFEETRRKDQLTGNFKLL